MILNISNRDLLVNFRYLGSPNEVSSPKSGEKEGVEEKIRGRKEARKLISIVSLFIITGYYYYAASNLCIDRSKAPKVSERQSTILSKFAWKEAGNRQTSNLGDYELGLLSKTRTHSGRTPQTLLHQTRTWSCSMSVPLPLTSNHKSQQWLKSPQKSSKAWPPPSFLPRGSPLAFALMT